MSELADKLALFAQVLEAKRGALGFFALFLRQDAPDRWDLLISAEWLQSGRQEGLAYVADELRSILTPDELVLISRIVIVDPGHPAVLKIGRGVKIRSGIAYLTNDEFSGLLIKKGYLFRT